MSRGAGTQPIKSHPLILFLKNTVVIKYDI